MRTKVVDVGQPDLTHERDLWEQGILQVVGMDEAGRGALAGPVAVGAVCLPPDPLVATQLHGVRDSKLLTPAEREYWAERIKCHARGWAVGFASSEEIDQVGIVAAVRMAAMRALDALSLAPQYLLIDYFYLPQCNLPQTALIKGDQRCISIAAASILAKTERDRWMTEIEKTYPLYGFAAHKGYGTALHLERLERYGACPIHRRSFSPVGDLIKRKEKI